METIVQKADFKVWIRTTDLWVMGPARYLCATLNRHDTLQPPCRMLDANTQFWQHILHSRGCASLYVRANQHARLSSRDSYKS